MKKLTSISKRAIAFAIVAALAVGGIALAGTVAVKVFSEPQLTPTADTHLLPGRYRNAPNYFYSAKTTDTGATVYVPAKHGDNLINSYEINSNGDIEILLQTGTIVPPYGPTVTTYFAVFSVVTIDPDTEEEVVTPLIDPEYPVPASGIYEVTIPAADVPANKTILIEFDLADSSGQPAGHTSRAYLILNPELVQVAYTNPIPTTSPNP